MSCRDHSFRNLTGSNKLCHYYHYGAPKKYILLFMAVMGGFRITKIYTPQSEGLGDPDRVKRIFPLFLLSPTKKLGVPNKI